MMPKQEDKATLETIVEMMYISPRYYHTIEGTQAEIEIREKLEGFKRWATKLINEKFEQ